MRGNAVDRLGDEARESAVGVTELGRSIFRTSAEAKRMGGVFQGVDGRLREANGRFVKGREALQGFGRAAGGATSSTQTFTRSLGGLGNILGRVGHCGCGRTGGSVWNECYSRRRAIGRL